MATMSLAELLVRLRPLVWVVGSHARGTAHAGSDVDLTPRVRADFDPGADRADPRSRERLMPEVLDVLAASGVEWVSPMMGYVVVHIDGMQVEVGEPMAVLDPDDDVSPATRTVEVAGVSLEALDPSFLAVRDGA